MILLCENEKLPHANSNDPCSTSSLKKPKRIKLFNRQMDILLKLSRKLLRIKVTPDLQLTYSKNGGNLELVL